MEHPNDVDKALNSNKKIEQYLVYGFGLVFIVVILVIAVAFPEPTPFQYTVFRIILALATAGIAAFVPGFIEVKISSIIRAGGAIAVFVIVYFFSPAQLAIKEVTNSATYEVIEQPIKDAIDDLASLRNKTAKIINCSDSFKADKVKPGIITGENVSDLIRQLQYRRKEPVSKGSYKVQETKEGLYEITCEE